MIASNDKVDILIIGGGLAGLTNALHLLRLGFDVLLVEKNSYPKHKVCGEYISNEVLPYLDWLEIDPFILGPSKISRLSCSATNGQEVHCSLPLGGFGISRYAMDTFLYQKAKERGCLFWEDTVESVAFMKDEFSVLTKNHGPINARVVIGAYGKRGLLDQKLKRSFIEKKSPWLAVKAHYRGEFPSDLVALHNFKGGYCGVSKVENEQINLCYLVNYSIFKQFKNIEAHQRAGLCQNPHLEEIFSCTERMENEPLTISQISFSIKQKIENHIIMIGDSAGLIHPLCGNGMAMAMHSAKICAESVDGFFNGMLKSRRDMEMNYIQEWNRNFKRRMQIGKLLAKVFEEERFAKSALRILTSFPSVLPFIVKQTHGKPLQ